MVLNIKNKKMFEEWKLTRCAADEDDEDATDEEVVADGEDAADEEVVADKEAVADEEVADIKASSWYLSEKLFSKSSGVTSEFKYFRMTGEWTWPGSRMEAATNSSLIIRR